MAALIYFGVSFPLELLYGDAVEGSDGMANVQQGLSLQIKVAGADGIVFVGEPASIKVRVKNQLASIRKIELRVSLKDDLNRRKEYFREIGLDGGGGETLNTISLDSSEPGFTGIHATLSENGKTLLEANSAIAVVRKPADYGKDNPDSLFAMVPADGAVSDPNCGETLARLGCKCVRQTLHAPLSLNPDASVPKGYLDGFLAGCRKHGIQVVLCPSFSFQESDVKSVDELLSPKKLEKWKNWVAFIAARYKGQLAGIELLNEPNGIYQKNSFQQQVDILSALTIAGAEAAKAVDPSLPVLGYSMSSIDKGANGYYGVFDAALAKSGKYVDICAHHLYMHHEPFYGVQFGSLDMKAIFPDEVEGKLSYRGILQQTLDVLGKNGCPKRLWPTETGWHYLGEVEPPDEKSVGMAAALCQAYAIAKSVPGVEKLFWFSLHWHYSPPGMGPTSGSFNLLRCNGDAKTCCGPYSPLPGASAYANMAWQLKQARYFRNLDLPAPFTGMRFERPLEGRTLIMLWARRDAEYQLTLSPPVSSGIFNMYGRSIGETFKRPLIFGRAPIFLTASSSDGDALEEALRQAEFKPLQPLRLLSLKMRSLDDVAIKMENTAPYPISALLVAGTQSLTAQIAPGEQALSMKLDSPLAKGEKREFTATSSGVTAHGSLSEETFSFYLDGVEMATPVKSSLKGKELIDEQLDEKSLDWKFAKELAITTETGNSEESPAIIDVGRLFKMEPDTNAVTLIRGSFKLDSRSNVNFYAGADYWAKIWIDGQLSIDLSTQVGSPPKIAKVQSLDLAKGTHHVLIKLVSGSCAFKVNLFMDLLPTPKSLLEQANEFK